MTTCQACGCRSRADDLCDHCRRPLHAAGPEPTGATVCQAPAVHRVSLTGEMVETLALSAPHTRGGGAAAAHAGSGPGMSMAAPDQGAALDLAYLPPAADEPPAAAGPPTVERWEMALAIVLPFVALVMLICHFAPTGVGGAALGCMLAAPLVLGAVGAIPRFHGDAVDCGVALVVTFLLGPLAAMGALMLVGLARRECSVAVVAVLGITIVVKALFGVAFAPTTDTAALAAMWSFADWLSVLGLCLGLVGWFVSGSVRRFGV